MFEEHSPEKYRQVGEKDCSQQVEHMQVPNGTGQGVKRSKQPLLACHTHCRSPLKPIFSTVIMSNSVNSQGRILCFKRGEIQEKLHKNNEN